MATPRILSGRYRLDELLARGGMADVHRATDLRLEREVAVKVSREPGDAARFAAEVRTLASLRHAHLVALLDAGADGDCRYLVMELRREPTLAVLLRAGPVAPDRSAAIATGLAQALAYVHARGVVHRDVKPGNVFVDERDHARLGDFGIARAVDASALTATGFTVGTVAYLAPEQLEGRALTPAVDVYALGLVMIECLTGRPAFEGTAAEITSARLVRDPDVPDTVPPRWRALLRAMTARDPDLRPSASRVAVEVHAATSTPPTRTLPVAVVPSSGDRTTAARSGPRLRRNLVALVGLTIATFLGVAAVVEATGGADHPSTATTTTSVVSTSTTVAPVTAAAPLTTAATTTATSAPRPRHRPARKTGGDHGHGRHGDG